MNKINLEFTSEQAGVLIPFFNNDLHFIYEWASLINESVDYKEAKFLEDCIILLRDGQMMNLDVVLEAPIQFKNTLIRLTSNIALTREKVLSPKEYDTYDDIIEVFTEGYKKFDVEV